MSFRFLSPVLLLAGLALPAQARPVTFLLTWDPIAPATASAVGEVTFDNDERFDATFNCTNFVDCGIVDLTVTVQGASAGNGTFVFSDFDHAFVTSANAVDLRRDLIGQVGFSDFNVFGPMGSTAPTGVDPFLLGAAGGTADVMTLVSMIAEGDQSLIVTTPATTCPAGGTDIHVGLDRDRSGVLEEDEFDTSTTICNGEAGSDGSNGANGSNGADGADGASTLVSVVDAGDACAQGGSRLRTGVDDDGNGSLDDTEVDDEAIVCNGNDGTAGADGGCAAGGTGSLLGLAALLRRRRRRS